MTKSQLIEVRSLASPFVVVKLALEAIRILLEENVGTDWKVNCLTQACGPLVKLAKAQLLYTGMLHKVAPHRSELKRLEFQAKRETTERNEVKTLIAQLEQMVLRVKSTML
ncbi:unnamed protein product [Angiostrongylus costaricensis]|uniref:COMM domain-containing protein n=1 Tax=Angiostrongylus costaricensis TaxID=334426 RepID=A0A0R3PSM4_ANGCS|nr:unnamed protein product [Angiostrongylus costaricensis]